MLYTAFKSQKSLNQSVKVIKAMTMPKIILTFMLVISLYVLGATIFWYVKNRHAGNIWPDFLHLFTKKTMLTFVLVVLYACSWKYLGFSISTFLYFTGENHTENAAGIRDLYGGGLSAFFRWISYVFPGADT